MRHRRHFSRPLSFGGLSNVLVLRKRIRQEIIYPVLVVARTGQEHNIFTFKTFRIGANTRYFSKVRLEMNNSIYYPQLALSANEESRLYRALMNFNSGYNDLLSGSLTDRSNFRNLFGIIYLTWETKRKIPKTLLYHWLSDMNWMEAMQLTTP